MEIRDVHALLGRTAYGADGDRVGTITGAYLDNETGRPSWITVERGGLFRTTRSFVPIDGVELVDDAVRVGVDADAVKRAPQIDDDRVLTQADERELRSHYGLARREAPLPAATGPDDGGDEPAQAAQPAAPQDAMTRSEERPRVTTTTVPASRAVLRRTRVVEDRTFSVPLGRDQVQVAYEPLPDPGPAPVTAQPPQGSAQGAAQGPAPGSAQPRRQAGTEAGSDVDDEGWVVLYEERLVVRTEWVPVERVRLQPVGVQGEEVVQVDLRRERIDVDVEHAADPPPVAAPAPTAPPAPPVTR
jgi:stress response protein YsnF